MMMVGQWGGFGVPRYIGGGGMYCGMYPGQTIIWLPWSQVFSVGATPRPQTGHRHPSAMVREPTP